MKDKELFDSLLEFFEQKVTVLDGLALIATSDFSHDQKDAIVGEDLTQMQSAIGTQMQSAIGEMHEVVSLLGRIRRYYPSALETMPPTLSSEFADALRRLYGMLETSWPKLVEPTAPTPAETDIASNEMVRKIISEIFKEMAESGKLEKVIGLETVVHKVIKEMLADGSLQKAIANYLRQEGGGDWQKWLSTFE